jgi:hypothetical protein
MQTEKVKEFYNWINERHRIYLKRLYKETPPWTDDPILQSYKFTNPFRENDRVTVWMRQNWTNLNKDKSFSEIIFNCCLFRMIGTSEFADEHGWVTEWDPTRTKEVIEKRLAQKERTFTGAYIITNQGLKAKKSKVVVDHFLTPIWEDQNKLEECVVDHNSLEKLHKKFAEYKGWGGGGFMAYEVVTDLNYTPVLENAVDRFSWANAGPGAVRGLNRINQRPLKQSLSNKQTNWEMFEILLLKEKFCEDYVPVEQVDMRTIEHSLCEWDKYERVRLNQGRPRSKFASDMFSEIPKGAVQYSMVPDTNR